MITHAIDLAVTNAWLQYIRDATQLKIPKKQKLDLLKFRQHVGEVLIVSGKTSNKKGGRPSNETPPPIAAKRQNAIKPVDDVSVHHGTLTVAVCHSSLSKKLRTTEVPSRSPARRLRVSGYPKYVENIDR
ncbi:hypothetical protein J6590_071328 [Homalodisca vitripennis]|nr:hypothetical protein J6590_071328 [Homalodisca vitripennis]